MLEIFQYSFMIRAFAAGLIIAVIAPIMGVFLIVRRYSLFADTLTHVSLLGIAVGVLTYTNPILTALAASLIGAVGMERLRARTKIYGESILALFLSGSLAIATVIISLARGFNASLLSFLFGSITTVLTSDLYLIGGLGVVILSTMYLVYKELFFIAFDEEAAKVAGLPVEKLSLLLMILSALTVALSIRIVGVLLIGALMVIPGITAIQFKRSFKQTILLAVIFSLLSVIVGLFLSYYFGLASGGSIAVVAIIFFLSSLLYHPVRS
ncbi:zinc transport system permease protein [Candidatus Hakubella thermalkaliphila]|uniref:Zinc transport system permease protein n=1 Tax=Candidatus Hakubella thermalkaliphila TaxID=2754717 RepID=A0A6V8PMG6_9ACTN|nr:zinc transport system permease protein [Candidatus Hakubella thermalkaliphila]